MWQQWGLAEADEMQKAPEETSRRKNWLELSKHAKGTHASQARCLEWDMGHVSDLRHLQRGPR